MGKLFGTDGIRGIANKDLTPELAYEVGRAGAYILAKESKGTVIVGKDTRISGDMLEAAITAGICSMGLDVISVGVIPTPAVAYLIRKYKALSGVVISASHNPGEYNGIKFFNNEGFKLPDEVEDEIEDIILNKKELDIRPIGDKVGKIIKEENASEDYIDYLVSTSNIDLTGIKIAMDCGHGALYKIAPETIRRLGGELVVINTEPTGTNINQNCGSTNPKMIQELVLKEKADIGISFDGDGDRIIAVDELGNVLDGDHILAACGLYLYEQGKLKNNTVVGTIMTNMGLDTFLKEKGINIVKTTVGDRYILEEMIRKDFVLGGEQSGHIIFLDYNTTGDGLATGLHLLEVMQNTGKTMSELNNLMTNFPQVLVNAKVKNELKYKYNENEEIKEEIKRVEDMFKGQGRVVIRPSGTEPLVRVMIEAKEDIGLPQIASDLAKFIEERIGN
ncbi:phosphoglucosamine mutase [Tissierella sp. MB52-C2]|uniref:phosphoglucosamine mutase n=1 Tax=Tissierella sp. MB52-C2 TaxID=3070999 RepID=UPI00280B847E|nr:phosphoglucosamine mutase [Tissierella sp. MB52-C2]WMM25700.1 phosphoglucosamine mutase [Tissierella sp. MB52-C2]